MSYFLTLNWYKTKSRKNTKLRVLVIDFTRHGGSENNRVGSEKVRWLCWYVLLLFFAFAIGLKFIVDNLLCIFLFILFVPNYVVF